MSSYVYIVSCNILYCIKKIFLSERKQKIKCLIVSSHFHYHFAWERKSTFLDALSYKGCFIMARHSPERMGPLGKPPASTAQRPNLYTRFCENEHNRRFSDIENKRFWLVFAINGSVTSGIDLLPSPRSVAVYAQSPYYSRNPNVGILYTNECGHMQPLLCLKQ